MAGGFYGFGTDCRPRRKLYDRSNAARQAASEGHHHPALGVHDVEPVLWVYASWPPPGGISSGPGGSSCGLPSRIFWTAASPVSPGRDPHSVKSWTRWWTRSPSGRARLHHVHTVFRRRDLELGAPAGIRDGRGGPAGPLQHGARGRSQAALPRASLADARDHPGPRFTRSAKPFFFRLT